jgi:hypothetical protein
MTHHKKLDKLIISLSDFLNNNFFDNLPKKFFDGIRFTIQTVKKRITDMLRCCILNEIIVHIKEFLGRSSKKIIVKAIG